MFFEWILVIVGDSPSEDTRFYPPRTLDLAAPGGADELLGLPAWPSDVFCVIVGDFGVF